jgi:hypothetical protein
MPSPKQKLLSRSEFLELLDDEDVAALWAKWQLPPAAQMSREAAAFVAAVDGRSNTTLLQDVMSLRTATLQMLRDVLEFLSNRMSAVRTTASLLVLNEEFDIAPQQVNAALKWSSRALRHSSATWEELAKRFETEVAPLLAKVAQYGAVRFRRRRENIVKAAMRIEAQRGPSRIRSTTEATYDPDGLLLREEYATKIKDLGEKISELRDRLTDAHGQQLLSGVTGLSRQYHASLRNDHADVTRAEEKYKRRIGTRLSEKDHEIWKLFAEDVFALADAEESASVVDLFRMDLFRKRPQLYEVWVVVAILRFMRTAGFKVEMLTLLTTQAGRIVWNLNYAKSQAPIARLARASDGSEFFLFYQLFRPGERRDEMPDIALMPSRRPDDKPVWIMDPKHSERGAYSRADYAEVGMRYQSAFSPLRTWIVEFYPRPELRVENPFVIAEGVELIRDVSPGSAGHRHLVEELHELHGGVVQTLAIVDVSGSFAGNLERVQDDLRELLAEGVVLFDDIIWFSDEAARSPANLGALKRGGGLQPPSGLGGGTNFGAALELAQTLCMDAPSTFSLRIYTDGQFGDVALSSAADHLRQWAHVEVVDFANAKD